jgi:hypothetical protein
MSAKEVAASTATSTTARKHKGREPAVWTGIVSVRSEVLASLDGTMFRPVAKADGDAEVRTPDRRAFALMRIGPALDGRRVLSVPIARKPRRSEQTADESAYSYLRLGLARLPEFDVSVQPVELIRLLKNAFAHVAGADIGRTRPQLGEMRGPAVRGGLPSLGKRRS